MRNSQLVWILVLLVLAFPINTAAQTEEYEISLNQQIESFLDDKFVLTKRYVLPLNFKKNEHNFLILSAEGTFEGSEPDIYADTKGFDSSKNAKFICFSHGLALCNIHDDELIGASNLYITIKCVESCGFQFVAFTQTDSQLIPIELNQTRYAIFEDYDRSKTATEKILHRIVQLDYSNPNLAVDENLESILIEVEMMNPTIASSTFNVFIRFGSTYPTSKSFDAIGREFGSGAGMGGLMLSKQYGFNPDNKITLNLQAHEGSIIAVRAFGWDKIRRIQPFQLVSQENSYQNGQVSNYVLTIQKNIPQVVGKNLILQLVPFIGDPNIYADIHPIQDFQAAKWSSQELLDDRIVITPKELGDNSQIYIQVKSDEYSLFSLRSYFVLDTITMNFDYPESASLSSQEMITYSLNIFANEDSEVVLTLVPHSVGKPAIFVTQCSNENKSQCVINQNGAKHKMSFDQETLVVRLKSDPSKCNLQKTQGLKYCSFRIGVQNPENFEVKFTLKATNGITHSILKEGEIQYYRLEYGNIKYYKLDLSGKKDDEISDIQFQLSDMHGLATMFISRQFPKSPTIYNKQQVSFSNSIHLSLDNFQKLNSVWYLGVQADSPVTSYSLQTVLTSGKAIGHIFLSENAVFKITSQENEGFKAWHFKFFMAQLQDQEQEIKIQLDAIQGSFEIRIGLSKDLLNIKETSKNQIIFTQNSLETDFPLNATILIYGIVIPTSTQGTYQFTLVKVSNKVSHQRLDLGVQNTVLLTPSPQYFKVLVNSINSIMITKKHSDSSIESDVIVSMDQLYIRPAKGDSKSKEILQYYPMLIKSDEITNNCKHINDIISDSNCFLFFSISGTENQKISLLIDVNTSKQMLFADYPTTIQFQPKQEKYLFHPILTSTEFNLFKSASMNGDLVVVCAKIFSNTIPRDKWPFPVKCEKNTYDFILDSKSDENYFYQLDKKTAPCDFDKGQCAVAFTIQDLTDKILQFTDTISLTLQQSHVTLRQNVAIMDSLPTSGARFYFVDEKTKENDIIRISVTEFIHDSIELILYSGKNKLLSTWEEAGTPSVIIDSEFRKKFKQLIQSDSFTVEIKSRSRSDYINYSIILSIEQEDNQSVVPIFAGSPLKIQLKNKEYRYFIYRNKKSGSNFKISISQQTQGFTQTSVGPYLGPKEQDYPIKQLIVQSYDSQLLIKENHCNISCSYIIQLMTQEPGGSELAITVNSAQQNEETTLLENIIYTNEFAIEETIRFKFNSLSRCTIYFNLIYGEVLLTIKNTKTNKSIELNLNQQKQFSQHLNDLSSINDYYIVEIQAQTQSKLITHFVSAESTRMISFDLPIHGIYIPQKDKKNFIIKQTGTSQITVQIQYKKDQLQEDGLTELDVEFSSNSKKIEQKTINQYYDSTLGIYVKHILLSPKESEQNIEMELINQSRLPISELSIYLSQNFTILDLGRPLYYYLKQQDQTMFYGIVLPQEKYKLLVSISSYNGRVLAQGTLSRDDALNGKFQFNSQGLYRQYFDVNVNQQEFFVRLKAQQPHTQGFIMFTIFPYDQDLPLNMISLPLIQLPIISGIKSISNDPNQIASIGVSYEPLSCISPDYKDNNSLQNFELISIRYSVILSHDLQLARATDSFHSQISGDLSSIKTLFSIFKNGENETMKQEIPMLLFNTVDDQECYNNCSGCGKKNLVIPLDNTDVDEFLQEKTFILVRAIVNWRMKNSLTAFNQAFYYSDVNFDKQSLILETQDEVDPGDQNSNGMSGFTLAVIVIIGLCLIGVAIYYFCKFKQTEQILNYELTDVRNIAHLGNKDINNSHIPLENTEDNSQQL